MVRIEVFLDESMFHAIPLSVPPSCDGLIPTLECSISVDTTGLTVTDPSGAVQPAHFLFGRMQSWGVGKGGSSIVIQTPRGPFTFSCEQSIQLVRKLTDISYMIHHAEHGHSGSHAAGAAPPQGQGEWFKGEIMQDPIGVELPKSCLFRVLPASLCITGRGTKDSLVNCRIP